MPPQPLSSIHRKVNPRLEVFAFQHMPQIGACVAETIALSAQAEVVRTDLLLALLGINARPAFAMFLALNSNRAQSEVISTAAKEILNDKMKTLFDAVIKYYESAIKWRHRFAHDLWGMAPELPDRLLLFPADGFSKISYENKKMFIEMFVDRTRKSHFMLDTRDIPRKKIFMITEKDVKEINWSIHKSLYYMERFSAIFQVVPSEQQNIYDLLIRSDDIKRILKK